MCVEQHALDYERTDDMSVLSDFYCGINEMDNYIHKHLQAKIDKEIDSQSFIIRKDGEIVAMTTIMKKDLNVDVEDERFCFDAMEIEYLAVKNDMRENGIGRQILEWIEAKIRSEYPEIKHISVCAYVDHDDKYSAEPFYRKCGFIVAKKPHPMMDYVKMVKTLE